MMSVFSDENNKKYFKNIFTVNILFALSIQIFTWKEFKTISTPSIFISLIFIFLTPGIFYLYLKRQEEIIENAEAQINMYLEGNSNIQIDSDKEGTIYRLFNSINQMLLILNARAKNETKEKKFLKDTISDISHQLKTPLAALNIYNELIFNEVDKDYPIKDLCEASDHELNRMNTLIQNLLKLAKFDADVIVLEKLNENVYAMIKDVELHFTYRAKSEKKHLQVSGDEKTKLFCDRDWLLEAINNIVKNAFDHTKSADVIKIEWEQFSSILQIKITDNGFGIHEDDLYHIFKRFYRSRHLTDSQGIGLGLPLAKSIIEGHGGTIEVLSELGHGTTFLLNFRNPTKL
ncbi:sensor histidine kinase [Anaerococcus provencensis]|uniref:sensor histidine kinase n=1 Tax=Anaerococcus provencensis TaxID=938293 RepID=UPI0002ED3AD6|nr:HAMP domain-containing sensor histidine kinase [Anaerococcus provencensis]